MLQRMVSSVCSEFANEERAKEVEVCKCKYSLLVYCTHNMCKLGAIVNHDFI